MNSAVIELCNERGKLLIGVVSVSRQKTVFNQHKGSLQLYLIYNITYIILLGKRLGSK